MRVASVTLRLAMTSPVTMRADDAEFAGAGISNDMNSEQASAIGNFIFVIPRLSFLFCITTETFESSSYGICVIIYFTIFPHILTMVKTRNIKVNQQL